MTIDVRMARSSGIGTYIREVVPRVFSDHRVGRPALLGNPADLRDLGLDARIAGTIEPCDARIYAPGEQLALRRSTPADTDLFWSPHYNIPLLYRGRLVVTVHDLLHLAHPEYVSGRHRRLLARVMFAAVRRAATAIICDSEFTAAELIRLTHVSAARLSVIHLGVDARWFVPAQCRSRHPRPYFLYVGNIKPHKNVGRLVEAFGSLLHSLPHDLLVVGRSEGLISGDTEAVAKAERLGGRLHLLGEVTEEALMAYVVGAEALVVPSRYEGFGLPALEAMAAGCPVVVSRAASLPEVCGDAALYFDPLDPADIAAGLRRIAGDPGLRQELIAAGRERARRFSWERCAEQTRTVLLHALDG